ncbi:MAG: hypothetical protein V7K32_12950 [Nostoc sp.]|uniref:hypothetical protein n=1 Tax=Nostoc sp. TaxID=1180 RepID=UPI002FFB2087
MRSHQALNPGDRNHSKVKQMVGLGTGSPLIAFLQYREALQNQRTTIDRFNHQKNSKTDDGDR